MLHNIYYAIGLYYVSKKSWKNAEDYILRAINVRKKIPSIWYYRLGFVLAKQKKWSQSEFSFRKAVDMNPDNVKYKIRLGISLEMLDKKIEAAEIYNSVIDRCNDHYSLYRMGALFYSLNRWKAAEDTLRLAIKVNSNNAKYYILLSNSLKKQNKNWQVIEILDIATKLDNTHPDWFISLGNELLAFAKYEEASKAFASALKLNPKEANFQYKYGYSLEKQGKILESETAYNLAIKYDIKLNAKNLGIGIFHQKNGLWLNAAQAYEKYTNKFPTNAELFFKAGYAYDRCHLWHKAILLFHSALLLDSNQPDWHYRLGYVLERTEQLDAAVEVYKIAVSTRSKHTPYWYYRLGFILCKLGKYEESCKYFIETKLNGYSQFQKSIDNDLKKQLDKPSYLLKYREQFDQNLDEMINQDALNPHVYYKLSVHYQKIGNLPDAIKMMEEAILHNDKHNGNWYYELGLLLVKSNNFVKASNTFLQMRIFNKPYSIDINPYLKNNKLKLVLQYNEYCETLPIRENTILYESFAGESVSCNPYAIFANIVNKEEFSNWTHVWVLNDIERIPDELNSHHNILICSRESDNYLRFLATSKYLINNSTFPPYFSRRQGQKYLNTWHGTPLKTLGKEMNSRFMEHKNGTRNFLQATHIVSPNQHTTNVILNDFDIKNIYAGKIAEIGYPRVDLTLSMDNLRKKDLLASLDIIDDKPILFYAPTWRGTHNDVSIDEVKIIELLNRVSKMNYNVIFRGHPLLNNLNLDKLSLIKKVPNNIDTNEILAITDILVTDYSSVFFDFLKTQKPIFFYCYDKQDYLENRGMYFEMNEMHGKCIETIDELCHYLNKPLKELSFPISKFNSDFCKYDDGEATNRAVSFFFNENERFSINKKEYQSKIKKNLLFFGGPFMPNGITSSLINLLSNIDENKYCIHLAIEPSAIQNFPERMELFNRLPKNIHIIPRVGLMNMTVDERYTIEAVHNVNYFPSDNFKDIYNNAHKREFKRLFGNSKFDSIINFEGYHKFWGALFASSENNNNLIYLHNEMFSEWKSKFPYLEIIFNLYSSYKKLVSVSPVLNQVNCGKLKCFESKTEKFISIPNLVNGKNILEKSMDNIDKDISNWITGDTLFVTIGRFSPEKDHKKLLYAFSETIKYFPNIQLLILGEGPLRDYLENLTNNLGLNEKVFFAGIRSNPFPILKKADCFILSSNHEGQPMVLLESLILNKQIIATDIPGNRGVLNEYGGMLVENDVKSLTEGMISFMNGTRTQNHFDFNNYFNSTLNKFYKEICNN